MSRSDYRTLVNHGRKAGLRTSELYQAMAAVLRKAADQAPGQADSNGFVSVYDQGGHAVYRSISDASQKRS